MKRALTFCLTLLLVACFEKDSAKVFEAESGLETCPSVVLKQDPPSKPQHDIDYTYETDLDGIQGCATLTRAIIERSGYLCQTDDTDIICAKVFDDGSIAQLRLLGDSAKFSRRHNR